MKKGDIVEVARGLKYVQERFEGKAGELVGCGILLGENKPSWELYFHKANYTQFVYEDDLKVLEKAPD